MYDEKGISWEVNVGEVPDRQVWRRFARGLFPEMSRDDLELQLDAALAKVKEQETKVYDPVALGKLIYIPTFV